MQDITFTFKNCPREVAVMLKVTFERAPKMVTGEPLHHNPAEPLTIDFDHITEPEMRHDVIHAAQIYLMAFSWLIVKKRQDEERGH